LASILVSTICLDVQIQDYGCMRSWMSIDCNVGEIKSIS